MKRQLNFLLTVMIRLKFMIMSLSLFWVLSSTYMVVKASPVLPTHVIHSLSNYSFLKSIKWNDFDENMVCDNNESNQLIDIDNQYSLVKQFKTISVVTALFWYGAPFAVRFVTNVCGCITRYIIDISSLLKQVFRNTLDSVKDVMLDEHQVMKVRIQYLMFILVNWNTISEILGCTHFDSKKKEIEKRDR